MKTAKTLGPDSAELLLRLSAEGRTIFSIAGAQAIADKSYEATSALLSTLVRKGWLVRLVPGKYLIAALLAGGLALELRGGNRPAQMRTVWLPSWGVVRSRGRSAFAGLSEFHVTYRCCWRILPYAP